MAAALSEDLRIGVIRAVDGGMSCNAAARRFGVSVSSAVRWMADCLATGRTAPKRQGGGLPMIGPHICLTKQGNPQFNQERRALIKEIEDLTGAVPRNDGDSIGYIQNVHINSVRQMLKGF